MQRWNCCTSWRCARCTRTCASWVLQNFCGNTNANSRTVKVVLCWISKTKNQCFVLAIVLLVLCSCFLSGRFWMWEAISEQTLQADVRSGRLFSDANGCHRFSPCCKVFQKQAGDYHRVTHCSNMSKFALDTFPPQICLLTNSCGSENCIYTYLNCRQLFFSPFH